MTGAVPNPFKSAA